MTPTYEQVYRFLNERRNGWEPNGTGASSGWHKLCGNVLVFLPLDDHASGPIPEGLWKRWCMKAPELRSIEPAAAPRPTQVRTAPVSGRPSFLNHPADPPRRASEPLRDLAPLAQPAEQIAVPQKTQPEQEERAAAPEAPEETAVPYRKTGSARPQELRGGRFAGESEPSQTYSSGYGNIRPNDVQKVQYIHEDDRLAESFSSLTGSETGDREDKNPSQPVRLSQPGMREMPCFVNAPEEQELPLFDDETEPEPPYVPEPVKGAAAERELQLYGQPDDPLETSRRERLSVSDASPLYAEPDALPLSAEPAEEPLPVSDFPDLQNEGSEEEGLASEPVGGVVVTVDGRRFDTLAGFMRQAGQSMLLIPDWQGDLNDFKAILETGIPDAPPGTPFTFVWLHSDKSRADLGYPETVRYRQKQLENATFRNRSAMKKAVRAALAGEGPTLFEDILSILMQCPSARVQLR